MTRIAPAKFVTSTPVVLFGSAHYASLAIVRTLGRIGVRVFCIDPDPNALGMKSRFCSGRFVRDIDAQRPEDAVRTLADVAREIGEKAVLLPSSDSLSVFVDRHTAQLSQWFVLRHPDPEAAARLHSKRAMYELCVQLGVPTPRTTFPDSAEDAIRDAPSLGSPLVVKPIDADLLRRSWRRQAMVSQTSDVREAYEALAAPGTSNVALQEFIPGGAGASWAVAAYFDRRGDCRFAITGQKLRQFPTDGGVTTFGVCAPCDAIVVSIMRIATAVGYRGILDADFRCDGRDGLWKLIDVNPRAGANFRLFTDKHGLDVVRSMYLDLTGQDLPAVEPDWGRRWCVEDLDLHAFRDHALAGSLTLRGWLRSLRGVSEFGYFAADDLWPSAVFGSRVIRYYAAAAARRLWRPFARKPSTSPLPKLE
jgi:D-aspartate ligase